MGLHLHHEFEADRAPSMRGLWRLAGLALLVGLGFYFAVERLSNHTRVAEPAQQVTLLDELLPPPEPPEIEPEAQIEEMANEPFEELAAPEDAPPAGDTLGLDAAGEAGGDQFGLTARKGGRDLLSAAGSGDGAGGNPLWHAYASGLERSLEDVLNANEALRASTYDITIKLWIGERGDVERAELMRTSGDRRRDAMIETALAAALVATPPPDLPQPLRLRIWSRWNGLRR